MTEQSQRLNKYLALVLGISRREADELIAQGKVSIAGKTASLGAQFLGGSEIKVSGRVVSETPVIKRLIMLHKPVGYVSSRRSQGSSQTIYDLLPDDFRVLKPVGRLDRDSSGLLLLTNDGDFAHRMTHPSFRKTKVYRIKLDRDLEHLHQQMISDFGINLEDGHSQLSLMIASDKTRKEWWVTMHEGRNRQIRRTFAALGYTVTRLHRTEFGNYSLGDLKRGAYRELELQ